MSISIKTKIPDNYETEKKKSKLLETEKRVFINISHYFRLLNIIILDLSIAYELWLKAILPILLDEVGLKIEEWDRICTIGDENQELNNEVDINWVQFLDKLKSGDINEEIWEILKKGKIESQKRAENKNKIIRRSI